MFIQDLRFAVRSFLRSPRFTVPAVIALALGIGATSAIFSVVRGVMLEPLPYRDPDRIVAVWENRLDRNRPRNVIAPANFVAWRDRATSFEFLGMVQRSTQNIITNGLPEELAGFRGSSDALKAFGTEPQQAMPRQTRATFSSSAACCRTFHRRAVRRACSPWS
jgi:putative ABC transport system permease protein